MLLRVWPDAKTWLPRQYDGVNQDVIRDSLRRYLAAGTQPNPGPYGGERRHYDIVATYAVPAISSDLGLDADSALAQLRDLCNAIGGLERCVELDRSDEVGRARAARRTYSVFEIPVAAIDG